MVYPMECPTDVAAHDKLNENEVGWYCRLPDDRCPYCQKGLCCQRLLLIGDASTHLIVHGAAGQC